MPLYPLVIGSISLVMAGCGNMPTPPSKIPTPYISSAQYEGFDCPRLKAEFDSLSQQEQTFVVAQENRISTSKGHAIFYGWGVGDGMDTVELAKVRGQREAVRRVRTEKKCSDQTDER
jgi:hypothetical protein